MTLEKFDTYFLFIYDLLREKNNKVIKYSRSNASFYNVKTAIPWVFETWFRVLNKIYHVFKNKFELQKFFNTFNLSIFNILNALNIRP